MMYIDYQVSIWIPFITENWKHCNKIIFKYVNSIVGPTFKVVFAILAGPMNNDLHVCFDHFQCNPNMH